MTSMSSDMDSINIERSPPSLVGALINDMSDLSWALLGQSWCQNLLLTQVLKPS